MDIGKHLEIPTIAARSFEGRLALPKSINNYGWIISFQDRPEVIFLDRYLNETKCLNLGGHSREYVITHIALSPNNRYIAVSARENLKITDGDGKVIHTIPHQPWGAFQGSECVFTSTNRLWYVQPGNVPGEDEHLKVINPESGEIVGQAIIKNQVGAFSLHPHPSQEETLIDIGCGQDDSYPYRAWFEGSHLTVQNYDFDDRIIAIPGAISPSGNEFVTAPHWGDAVKVHEFRTGKVLASLEEQVVFKDDYFNSIGDADGFGFEATFLDTQRILVDTRFGRLLLLDRSTMTVLGTIWPEGHLIRPYSYGGNTYYEGDITSFNTGALGELLAVYREHTIRLLNIQTLLSEATVF